MHEAVGNWKGGPLDSGIDLQRIRDTTIFNHPDLILSVLGNRSSKSIFIPNLATSIKKTRVP